MSMNEMNVSVNDMSSNRSRHHYYRKIKRNTMSRSDRQNQIHLALLYIVYDAEILSYRSVCNRHMYLFTDSF